MVRTPEKEASTTTPSKLACSRGMTLQCMPGSSGFLSKRINRWAGFALRQFVRGTAAFWLVLVSLWLLSLFVALDLTFRHRVLLLSTRPVRLIVASISFCY